MNTNRRDVLLLGGASLALAGCGDLLGPPPAPPIYVLEALAPVQPMAKLAWSLSVMRPTAPAALNSDRVPLIQPDLTLDYYANANLPDAIPDLVQAALVQAFEKSGAPTSVARETDALHADYDLFIDIRDFELRYAVKDGVPEALVTLTARLATTHGRTVAGTTTVSQRAPASANSVAAATAALGQALGAVAAGIVNWAVTFPAPASPRGPDDSLTILRRFPQTNGTIVPEIHCPWDTPGIFRMLFLRSAAAALLVCASLSQAMAENMGPLPAGKPAGTHQAALMGDGLLIALSLAAIIAATVAIAETDNNKGVTTPTTSATATNP